MRDWVSMRAPGVAALLALYFSNLAAFAVEIHDTDGVEYVMNTNQAIDFSPYYKAILRLVFRPDRIDGQLSPLRGDKTAHLRVTGTMYNHNKMKLNFDTDPKVTELVFSKKQTNNLEIWEADQGGVEFRKFRNGELSEAAHILYSSCASNYVVL